MTTEQPMTTEEPADDESNLVDITDFVPTPSDPTTTIVAVACSLAAVSSVAGGAYYWYRKRKLRGNHLFNKKNGESVKAPVNKEDKQVESVTIDMESESAF